MHDARDFRCPGDSLTHNRMTAEAGADDAALARVVHPFGRRPGSLRGDPICDDALGRLEPPSRRGSV